MKLTKEIKYKWLPFTGKLVDRNTRHGLLKATDGSGGLIKVKLCDIKVVDDIPFLRPNCQVQIIRNPKTHPRYS